MKPTTKNLNPDGLVDGEFLPVLGGPLDGGKRKVEILMGQLPNAGFAYGPHWYKRDGRKYVYTGEIVKGKV